MATENCLEARMTKKITCQKTWNKLTKYSQQRFLKVTVNKFLLLVSTQPHLSSFMSIRKLSKHRFHFQLAFSDLKLHNWNSVTHRHLLGILRASNDNLVDIRVQISRFIGQCEIRFTAGDDVKLKVRLSGGHPQVCVDVIIRCKYWEHMTIAWKKREPIIQ